VNSSQGGGSKDTWVMSGDGQPPDQPERAEPSALAPAPAPAAPRGLFRDRQSDPFQGQDQ